MTKFDRETFHRIAILYRQFDRGDSDMMLAALEYIDKLEAERDKWKDLADTFIPTSADARTMRTELAEKDRTIDTLNQIIAHAPLSE
jgi:hypothetical protein